MLKKKTLVLSGFKMAHASWLDGSDDSGIFSDSDEVSQTSFDDDENIEEMGMGNGGANFFFDHSDSEDDVKRTIVSAQDKRFGELDKSVKKIRNSMKINDWSAIIEGMLIRFSF